MAFSTPALASAAVRGSKILAKEGWSWRQKQARVVRSRKPSARAWPSRTRRLFGGLALQALLLVQAVNQIHPALWQRLVQDRIVLRVQSRFEALDDLGTCLRHGPFSPMAGVRAEV